MTKKTEITYKWQKCVANEEHDEYGSEEAQTLREIEHPENWVRPHFEVMIYYVKSKSWKERFPFEIGEFTRSNKVQRKFQPKRKQFSSMEFRDSK